ncbi:hypothetical protein CBOM_04261 [Ceraceosorus bombacis]|uniref:Uncharacterized protein n=1 Tax=Ceraceosorus bombacis TaxID=401625 RepID=A0A0P1BNY5_9BASI|nr:hypothetical protein CBOM_04261 [Ceraceosorus bombacis]
MWGVLELVRPREPMASPSPEDGSNDAAATTIGAAEAATALTPSPPANSMGGANNSAIGNTEMALAQHDDTESHQPTNAYTQHLGAVYAPIPLRHLNKETFHKVWHYFNQVRVPAGFCRFPVDSTNPISLATPQAKTAARMTLDAQLRSVGLATFEVTLNTTSNILRSADIWLVPPVTDLQRLTLRSSQLQLQGAQLSFAFEGREIPRGCTFFTVSYVSATTLEKPHQLLASHDGHFAHHGQRIESLC